MLHECRVYNGHPDAGAALIKIHSRKSLEARSTAMFASESKSYYAKSNAPDLATCRECGREFWQVKSNHKYCPGPCRQRAYKRRKKDRSARGELKNERKTNG